MVLQEQQFSFCIGWQLCNDYAQRIESVGLRAIEDHYANNLTDEIISRSGLIKEETLYRAEKL